MKNTAKNSFIQMVYCGENCQPNGDLTGDQRFDVSTGKALVSDVRIKRYSRDFLESVYPGSIFVVPPNGNVERVDGETQEESKGTDCAARMKEAAKDSEKTDMKAIILEKFIDARAFGATLTGKGKPKNKNKEEVTGVNAKINGAIQSLILNKSLNTTELVYNQNTSVWRSSEKNNSGAIGGSQIAKVFVGNIKTWIREKQAEINSLTEDDVSLVLKSTYNGINTASSRSKVGLSCLIFVRLIFKKPFYVPSILNDKFVSLKKRDISSLEELELDYSLLKKEIDSGTVSKVQFLSQEPIKSLFLKDMEQYKDYLEEINPAE